MLLFVAIGRRVVPVCLTFLCVVSILPETRGEIEGMTLDGKLEAEELVDNEKDVDSARSDSKLSGNEQEDWLKSRNSYLEVEDKLREIFSKGVEPGITTIKENQEESFKDYLEPDVDGNRQIVSEYVQINSNQRRRELLSGEGIQEGEILSSRSQSEDNISEATARKRTSDDHGRQHHHSGHEHTNEYLNEWVVHLTGGEELAKLVAKDLGYEFLGQVGDFKDIYRLAKRDHPRLHKREAPELTQKLNIHPEVKWAEQQFSKERAKRSFLPVMMNPMGDGIYDPYAPKERVKRIEMKEEIEKELMEEGKEQRREQHSVERRSALAAQALEIEKKFNDELWPHQWYLFDTRTRGDLPKLDLQVLPVWKANITGKGVRVVVLDDGLEWSHEDLVESYDPTISYDFNDNDPDATPRYDSHMSNAHGTRCAGEIVMKPNNRKCGVGVAYDAKIGGVRMLDGPVSDVVEGSSLGFNVKSVDVFSSSWGPTDDGRRVEGPGRLAQMAILDGVTKGRGGKGAVYVWAAGNGGSVGDDCNCDGYTSSIYTLSISSASETGLFPWYGERCASTLAAAYSSGAYTDQKIATTDIKNTCTDKFSGTSAAAPLAAGIIALALEANPALTWRDVQHAVVWSSEWVPLGENAGWSTNGIGLKFNPRFGFGLLSADGLVQKALKWKSVPKKVVCAVNPTSRTGTTLKTGGSVTIEFEDAGCKNTDVEVRSMEHVQVILSVNYTRRGALSINLTSPAGTTSPLLHKRVDDNSSEGFKNWPFMTVHLWGENPKGVWKVEISDETGGRESGTVGEATLLLHGTKKIPSHLKEQKRSYKIPYEAINRNYEKEEESDSSAELTAENLKSLSWEELLHLLAKRSSSTFSAKDIEMLLKEDRLEKALKSIQPERVERNPKSSDLWMVAEELYSRK